MSGSTKQKQKQPPKKSSSQEPPAHLKSLYEISKPKTNEVRITKEDQQLIDQIKRHIKEIRGVEWPDEDIYRILQEVKTQDKVTGAIEKIMEGSLFSYFWISSKCVEFFFFFFQGTLGSIILHFI
jgi:hypothetical protein